MKSIDRKELEDLLERKSDITLINVLSQDAFEKRHIPGSKNIPLKSENFLEKVENAAGAKDKTIVVYCASEDCDASPKAAKKLDDAGFTHVLDYEGGTDDWKQAGRRIEGTEAA